MNRSTCYHCHVNPPNRHSNFCDECLALNGRKLIFSPAPQPASPLTRLLYLGAIAATVWLIFKTAEAVMMP